MARRSSWLALICFILTTYTFCSYVFWPYTWTWAPPRGMIFVLSLLAFVTGLFGSQAKGCWPAFRSLSTTFLSFILSLLLLITVVIPWSEPIRTTYSPKHDHRLDVYSIDMGAPASLTFDIYLKGPLWAKKRIFTATRRPKIEWLNDAVVLINGHRERLSQ